MDTNIAKSLEMLETKKQHVNNQTDLKDECESLIELDKRVGTLLIEIQALHTDVEQRYEIMEESVNRLSPSNVILHKASDALDLLVELTKLNRLCHRIDTNPHLERSQVDGCMNLRLSAPTSDANNTTTRELDQSDKLVYLNIKQMIEDFESTYQPLEGLLSKRLDLPYTSYATRVRNLKESMFKGGLPV